MASHTPLTVAMAGMPKNTIQINFKDSKYLDIPIAGRRKSSTTVDKVLVCNTHSREVTGKEQAVGKNFQLCSPLLR